MNHRPSVIAAAATLLAVNRDFTIDEVEIEINALPINRFLLFVSLFMIFFFVLMYICIIDVIFVLIQDNVYYCYLKLLLLNYSTLEDDDRQPQQRNISVDELLGQEFSEFFC